MRKNLFGFVLAATGLLVAGCPNVARQTSAVFRNDANFPVEVRAFYGENQEAGADLLKNAGTEINLTLQPGEAETVSRDCEFLQAIYIDNADLRIIGGIGPSSSSRVFRDDSDFGCGDTMTFTFTQNALGTELDINFSQTNN